MQKRWAETHHKFVHLDAVDCSAKFADMLLAFHSLGHLDMTPSQTGTDLLIITAVADDSCCFHVHERVLAQPPSLSACLRSALLMYIVSCNCVVAAGSAAAAGANVRAAFTCK